MSAKVAWDAELYEAKHGFVWQFGENVVDLLDPKPGERILDLGCGTGRLTHMIAERGAEVVGLDSSPAMVGQARQNFPDLKFVLEDATQMEFEDEFDAIYSNAALHWIPDAASAARAMARALRTRGRLVAEFGAKGNVHQILNAIESTVERFTGNGALESRTYFPSIGEYSGVLEAYGFEVRMAHVFDRPTPLEGESGMENWIRQFKWYYFESLPGAQRNAALDEVISDLRPVLFREGTWYADYRRLRILALKMI